MTDDLSWTTSDIVEYKGVEYKVSDYYEAGEIDGGYLFCLEKNGDLKTDNGTEFKVDKPEGISVDMKRYLYDYYNAFENALFADDYCVEYNGEKKRYTDFVDAESLAKGILVNEIFENKDFGFRSTYFSKDIGQKMIYGPVWDFDLSSGYDAPTSRYDVWKTLSQKWIARVCSDDEFLEMIREFYWQYRFTVIEDMIKENGNARQMYEKNLQSGIYDESLWNYDTDYRNECSDLIMWLRNRINWLDAQFASHSVLRESMKAYIGESTYTVPEITSLRIDEPAAVTSYKPGDSIDLTGLTLTAVYSDSTEKRVVPDAAISLNNNYIGTYEYSLSKIIDAPGSDARIRLYYDGMYTEYPVDVQGGWDYEAVIRLIDKFPSSDLSEIDIRYLLK